MNKHLNMKRNHINFYKNNYYFQLLKRLPKDLLILKLSIVVSHHTYMLVFMVSEFLFYIFRYKWFLLRLVVKKYWISNFAFRFEVRFWIVNLDFEFLLLDLKLRIWKKNLNLRMQNSWGWCRRSFPPKVRYTARSWSNFNSYFEKPDLILSTFWET